MFIDSNNIILYLYNTIFIFIDDCVFNVSDLNQKWPNNQHVGLEAAEFV